MQSKPIDPELAKSLSEKPDQELMDILEKSADWKPEVVEFARAELNRRSVSTVEIEQKFADKVKQNNEELQKRSNVPLTFWESFFTILFGAGLGLFGLFFVWPQASRFKNDGYILKSKKSWRLYWFAFGARLTVAIILIAIAVSKSSH